jgi:polyhydroxyalkanoate synthase
VRWLAVVAWLLAAVVVFVWAAPVDTDRRRLQAGPLRRTVRAWRASVLGVLLALLGWPHLVDLAFGTGRVRVGRTPADVVWRSGSAVLVRYRRTGPAASSEPVLVVHSTVSQPWILDLTPTRSFVASLLDAGFDVFLLDWGSPLAQARGTTPGGLGLEQHAVLLRAAEAAVLAASGAQRLHRVGYCFAASLSLYDQVSWPAPHLASVVLIAPVADFDTPGGFRSAMANRWVRPVLALDGRGLVPAPVIRESFHGLRPQAVRTMWTRWRGRRLIDSEYREFYAAMAKWAWTHRPMPGALLFDVLDNYRTNPLLPALRSHPPPQPMLAVVAQRDHIVPPASSLALTSVPGLHIEVLDVPSGHVSMLVGSAARSTTWPGIADWLRAHSH